MSERFLNFLSQKKTLFFLIMCLCVHAFNAALFYALGILPLALLNVFSTSYYVAVLLLFKRNTDLYIIFTYFEILNFSLLSELVTGGRFFYIFFIIGMVSAIFYMLPPNKKKKHLFQLFGILYGLAVFYVYTKKICVFPQYLPIVESTQNPVCLLNLCITMFTVFYISNLYFFELNTAQEKLAYTSNHDLLTGLFNRRFFEHIMQRNKTENENDYTIALFDIDDFKKVNDTYGHQAGDEVLKMVSSVIEQCRENDYVPVRWGGEEFILYMPDTNEQNALSYLESLRRKISSTTVFAGDHKINITITIGMCSSSALGDYESIIRTADDRLYQGKRSGKNQVVYQ